MPAASNLGQANKGEILDSSIPLADPAPNHTYQSVDDLVPVTFHHVRAVEPLVTVLKGQQVTPDTLLPFRSPAAPPQPPPLS